MMHGHEKSDSVIVAAKPANKVAHPAVEQSAAEPTTAEPVEPRAETKGNADPLPGSDARAVREICAVTSSREDTAHRVRTLCGGTPQAARAWQAGDLQLPGLYLHLRQDSPGQIPDQKETRRDRMRAKLKMIKEEMWRRMHQPIPEQGKWLGRVVSGYFDYHAVPTNGRALAVFGHHVTDLWRHALRRRSQKDRITWAQMTQLVNAWLPKPIILHPWPSARFA